MIQPPYETIYAAEVWADRAHREVLPEQLHDDLVISHNRRQRRERISGGRWRLRSVYRSVVQRGVLNGQLERTT